MTGPVILGRAGRTPLPGGSYVVTWSRPYPFPPPEIVPLSKLNTPCSILSYATFALLHRSTAPICTFARLAVFLARVPPSRLRRSVVPCPG
jgi:hypothetical protein